MTGASENNDIILRRLYVLRGSVFIAPFLLVWARDHALLKLTREQGKVAGQKDIELVGGRGRALEILVNHNDLIRVSDDGLCFTPGC